MAGGIISSSAANKLKGDKSLFVASALLLTFVALMHTAQSSSSSSEPGAVPVPVQAAAAGNPTPQIDCGAACARRCKLASRQKMCRRACGTCCSRCNCVPPGTSGNQNVCPCYATMTTHGGKRKCP